MAHRPLSTAADLMTSRVVTVSPSTPVFRAIELVLAHGLLALPVVDEDGAVLGLLTQQNCLDVIASATYDDSGREELLQVGRCMSEATSVSPDTEVYRIVDLFRNAALRTVVVLDRGTLVGVVSRSDLLKGLKTMETEILAGLHQGRRDPLTPSSFFGATRHDASEVASKLKP